jgi:bifunctional UDP-N-acetylglucosamine pyrophosphorylase / glucosamine-1-phosphate N-acetyltransferase
MSQRAAIILAAGQGTRMRSELPKVMHQVGGRAMIDWSIALAQACGCGRIIVVCSPSQTALRAHVADRLGDDAVAIQETPLGTGHAVLAGKATLSGFEGALAVLYGDTPLIPASAVEELFARLEAGAGVGVLGFEAADPGAYGRLITHGHGEIEAIVEARDASPEQLEIRLCNSGVMAARAGDMFTLLSRVTNDNSKGEYYLTDIIALARKDAQRCLAVECDEADVLGVNSRSELARAETAFQARRRSELLAAGVTLTAPETVFFSWDTQVGNDVIIEPHVVFGPGVTVESGAQIRAFSHLEGAEVSRGAVIGPYARLRPGAQIGQGARVGNFVEVKKTRMGAGAKANHLAYLGDGEVGANANIGAGTIFCNYDGYRKLRTEIGEGAFIGSNSSLVAPVSIGAGAFVGSGSVVTKAVPGDALALARSQQVNREGWAVSYRKLMSGRKESKDGQ